MERNDIENELKRVLELDIIRFVKSDDIAFYYEGSKGEQIISIKYVTGRVFIKSKESWNLLKEIFINVK